MKRNLALSSVVVMLLIAAVQGAAASAAAPIPPTTLYTPASGDPTPGSSYTRVIRLEHSGSSNGTMLATFERNAGDLLENEELRKSIPIYRSTDDGETWTQITEVDDAINAGVLGWQPHLYELPEEVGSMPAGTLVLAASIPDDNATTTIELYKSTDHGSNWTYLSTIDAGVLPL